MKPSPKKAIKILSEVLDKCRPEMLAYWVGPNTILTLAGARPFCDGVFWSDDTQQLGEWVDEINTSLDVIKSVSTLVWSRVEIDEPRKGETCASYELMFNDGLDAVINQTKIIDRQQLEKSDNGPDFPNLMARVMQVLSAKPEFRNANKEELSHIAFGILLGYPDKAITESIIAWRNEDDPFAEPTVNADIRGGDYYICPQPIYSYPRHLLNDPEIKDHEKLWSEILTEYYHSDFHQELENNAEYNAKMKSLGSLR